MPSFQSVRMGTSSVQQMGAAYQMSWFVTESTIVVTTQMKDLNSVVSIRCLYIDVFVKLHVYVKSITCVIV